MRPNVYISLLTLSLALAAACSEAFEDRPDYQLDASTQRDMGVAADAAVADDAGRSRRDALGRETSPGADDPDADDPDADGPDAGPYTVEQAMLETCTTGSVVGLSYQLIDQMNCLAPGTMRSFEGADELTYSSVVFPFLQAPATDALLRAAESRQQTLALNSALRTLAQQYLLYQWYNIDERRRACDANLAASPGNSNHNGGLAVDIDEPAIWQEAMWEQMFFDDIVSEPWHFDYTGEGARDVRSLSVRAFQLLWNANNPHDPIEVDGDYGPQTEGALRQSPADGFESPPRCASTMLLQAFPFDVPMTLRARTFGEATVRLETLAPSGISRVEYRLSGKLIASVARTKAHRFAHMLVLPPQGGKQTLQAIGYDRDGRRRGQTVELIPSGVEIAD